MSGGTDGDYFSAGDNVIEKTVILSSYGSGVSYGHGNAANPIVGSDWDDEVTFGDATDPNVAVFDSTGMLTTQAGYVYLHNNDGTCFGVGALTSGAVLLRRWFDPSNQWG